MTIPIFVSAILPIIISFGPADDLFFVAVMVVTWGVFITDYVVHARLLRGYARSRRGLFDLGVVMVTAPWFLIPGLGGSQFVAVARLARLARVAKVSGGSFRRLIRQLGRVGLYTLLLIVSAAYVAYQVEQPVNDQFASYGDSVFWAIVTVTTVGYGDIVPITAAGRFMAVILMFSGVGLLGVLAGTLASFFGFGDGAEPDQAEPTDLTDLGEAGSPSREPSLSVSNGVDVDALRARLAELDAAVAAIRSQLP